MMTYDWAQDLTPDDVLAVNAVTTNAFDNFGTKVFSPDGGDQTGPVSQFLYAWKNPDTDFWRVEKVTCFNAPDAETEQNTELYRKTDPVRRAVSLFEALSACADFEYDRDIEGIVCVSDAAGPENYYRTVAEQTGFPLGQDGRLLPAAHGHILSSERHDIKAVDIAKKTLESPRIEDANEKAGGALLSDLRGKDTAGVLVRTGTKNTLPDAPDVTKRLRLLDQFEQAAKATVDIENRFKKEARSSREFRKLNLSPTAVKVIFWTATALSGGAVWAMTMYSARLGKSSYRYINNKAAILDKLAETLPENGSLPGLLRSFATSARGAFHLERANECRYSYDYFSDKKCLDKGARHIEKAAAILQLSDTELQGLQKDFMQDRLGKPGDNSDHLGVKGQAVRATIAEMKSSL